MQPAPMPQPDGALPVNQYEPLPQISVPKNEQQQIFQKAPVKPPPRRRPKNRRSLQPRRNRGASAAGGGSAAIQNSEFSDYQGAGNAVAGGALGAGGDNEGSGMAAMAQQNSQFSTISRGPKFLWYQKGGDNSMCKLLIIIIIFGLLQNGFCILCLTTDFLSQMFCSEKI